MLRRPSSSLYVRSQCSNVFFYETTWLFIQVVKFHIEHPLEGGTKVCINGHDHKTKMVAIPIYGKNIYKSSSPEPGVYDLKIVMHHRGLNLYKAGINDDLWLTLTYFNAWSKLVACTFEWIILLQNNYMEGSGSAIIK